MFPIIITLLFLILIAVFYCSFKGEKRKKPESEAFWGWRRRGWRRGAFRPIINLITPIEEEDIDYTEKSITEKKSPYDNYNKRRRLRTSII